jgi:hypothetical protein
MATVLARLACALALLSIDPGAGARTQPAMDGAAWREDLKFAAAELPARHKNAFHTMSRAEWDRRVAELDAALPSLADHQAAARLAALVAAIGDAHTSVDVRPYFRAFPVQFKAFPDGTYVVGATPEHTDLIGGKLVSIDGTEADAARAAVSPMATPENEVMHRMQTTRMLAIPEALHAFGVTASPDRAAFAFELEGKEIGRELQPLERGAAVSWILPGALTGDSGPIYVRNQRQAYWWTWLNDRSVLYVAYNRCAIDPERPFGDFAKEVMDEIGRAAGPAGNGAKPFKAVIDLRNNGGGNSAVFLPLLNGLRTDDRVNQRGALFVLIGARTQSSGMMNALQLRNATEAILIGEPTGGRPNSYGEMRELKLPRSGLTVWYSTKYFRQISGEDPPSVMPDVLVEPTATEFFKGADPVMDRVRAWKE